MAPLPELVIEAAPQQLILILRGAWIIGQKLPPVDSLIARLRQDDIREVMFITTELEQWDSLLLVFLNKLGDYCLSHDIVFAPLGLPEGAQALLQLADAVPERQDARREHAHPGWLARIGLLSWESWQETMALLSFTGETTLSIGNLLLGKAQFRRIDLIGFIQHTGPDALPIVSLISVLVGAILAFVGAVQLRMFGAQVYIADLVGLGMAREMGAMMTAIIMAGRTGAAYAAQLGTMQVNDEIDALKTFGFAPMEFLVLPRMLALVLMMPLLCIYADVMGIVGGGLVAMGMFDVSWLEYTYHLQARLNIGHFLVGIVKCAVFGILVALAGCMCGMRCGRSSAAVGIATTRAVVMSIVFIVVSDAIMTLFITAMKW